MIIKLLWVHFQNKMLTVWEKSLCVLPSSSLVTAAGTVSHLNCPHKVIDGRTISFHLTRLHWYNFGNLLVILPLVRERSSEDIPSETEMLRNHLSCGRLWNQHRKPAQGLVTVTWPQFGFHLCLCCLVPLFRIYSRDKSVFFFLLLHYTLYRQMRVEGRPDLDKGKKGPQMGPFWRPFSRREVPEPK